MSNQRTSPPPPPSLDSTHMNSPCFDPFVPQVYTEATERAGHAGREASNTIQNVDVAIVPSKNVRCVSHWHSFLAPSLVTAPDAALSIWRVRDFRP